MKKYFINIVLILTIIIAFILQNVFFSWFNINGIMPNTLVIIIVFIRLFSGKSYGIIYGIIIGLIYDLLYSKVIGISSVLYAIIGLLVALLDRNFSKDNRITIILTTVIATIFLEVTQIIISYFLNDINFSILAFVKILSIELLYNSILCIIFYPLIQKFGFYIENEYRGNKILTRYF